jgi:hypothetical protein
MANKIEIIIDGKNIGAINAITGVETKLKSSESKIDGFGNQVKNAFGSVGTQIALAGAAAATGFALMIKNAIDTADKLSVVSQQIGVGVEALSTLQYAAKLNDVEFETLTRSLGKFSATVYTASTGTGDVAQKFKQMGIELRDAGGQIKTADVLLLDVANVFQAMPDGVNKTATAMQLFGKSGKDLIPLLNNGAKGISSLQAEAKKLGLEISTNTAQRANEFNDNIDRLKSSVSGVAMRIAEGLIPSLLSLSNAMVAATSDQQNAITISAGLGMAIKILTTVVGGAITAFIVFAETLGTFWAVAIKIITLQWGSIGEAVSVGFDKVKGTSLAAGASFKALWQDGQGVAEMMGQINNAANQNGLQNANDGAKKLAQSWREIKNQLIQENTIAGLNEFEKKEKLLVFEANKLREQFYKIPGALDLINFNLAQKLSELYKPNADVLSGINNDPNLLKSLTPEMDLTKFRSGMDVMRSTVADVSTESLAHFAMMQSGTDQMFGDMAAAAFQFYQNSGEQNKSAFGLYKAFAIAQASIATYQSAVEAYKSMVGIPIIGPGLAIAAAAAATAFGIARIGQISAMQPGGRASSGSGASAPSVPSSNQSVVNNNSNVNKNVTINISASNPNTMAWVRDELAPQLQKAINDGVLVFG